MKLTFQNNWEAHPLDNFSALFKNKVHNTLLALNLLSGVTKKDSDNDPDVKRLSQIIKGRALTCAALGGGVNITPLPYFLDS